MKRTRDTHQHLHGQTIPIDDDFELSDGDKLNYPGDPNGRPENIINCRCRLIYEVADEGSKNNIKDSDNYELININNWKATIKEKFPKWEDSNVILTAERKNHIFKGHKDVYDYFVENYNRLIQNPDFIVPNKKHEDSVMLVSQFDKKHYIATPICLKIKNGKFKKHIFLLRIL